MQNLIESNAKISQELNLLRGQGSRTIQGNLLTLPVAGGLLYVEPYYVQARENAVYPTLQRVAAVYGENIGFAPTLGEALSQVFGTAPDSTPGGGTGGTGGTGPESPQPGGGTNDPQIRQAIADADRAFTAGQDALRKDPPDFTAYGNAQKDLADALDRLGRLTAAPPPPSPPASPEPPPSPPPAAAPDAAPAAPPTTVAPAGAPGG